MSEEKERVYEKAKGEMRLSERILAELPGFRGYKEKELRRESDKLLRNHLYRKLSEAKSELKKIFQKLSDYRRYEYLTEMDRLVAVFDRVAERINHASYGYTGFFDAIKIDEADLDRMIEFDSKMLEQVNNVVKAVSDFKVDIDALKFDETKKHMEKLGSSLSLLEKTFNERTEVILGVK